MKEKLLPVVTQQKIATNILRRCIKISNKTPHDVFCNYSPHVKKIEIHVHRGGWKSCIDSNGDIIKDVENPAEYYEVYFNTKYYCPEKEYQHISAILDELEKDIK